MKNKQNINVLSGFTLKLLAIITMTIDHIGWAMREFLGYTYFLVAPFRFIGRLALPLFCFLCCEGVMHTKNFAKYMLRMGIIATGIAAAFVFVEYTPFFEGFSLWGQGNIFIDLMLGSLMVYCLKNKNVFIKLLSLIPLAIGIVAFYVTCMEYSGTVLIYWFPFFLRPQYQFYGMLMVVGCYLAYLSKDAYLKWHEENTGVSRESLDGTNFSRMTVNIFSFVYITIATLLLYSTTFFVPAKYIFWQPDVQNAAIISGAFIIFYNGKRGYNKKWFQYGCYLYYPIHLLLVFGLAMLMWG